MSWVATAIVGGSVLVGGATYLGSKASASAAEKGTEISVDAQKEALNYIKENEAIPQELRRQALEKLGSIYGLPGINSEDSLDPSMMLPGLNGQQLSVQDIKNRIYELQGNITKYQGYSNVGHAARNIGAAQTEINKLQDILDNARQTSGTVSSTSGQQDLIDQAINSPLYKSLLSGLDLGEEAIMRNAGATGGLRSGNVQGAMFDYTTQLQNQALLSSYNEQLKGLTGLAMLPSNTNDVASYIAGIGNTQAQGQIANAAMTQQGIQSGVNNALGFASLGLQAYKAGMFSDRRLKKNIVQIGTINGYNFYSFDWNKLANELGLTGSTCGCMADEVYEVVPEAVMLKDGFLFIDYSAIGVL